MEKQKQSKQKNKINDVARVGDFVVVMRRARNNKPKIVYEGVVTK